MHPFWLIPGAIAFWHFIKWCTEENHEEAKHSNTAIHRSAGEYDSECLSGPRDRPAATTHPPTVP